MFAISTNQQERKPKQQRMFLLVEIDVTLHTIGVDSHRKSEIKGAGRRMRILMVRQPASRQKVIFSFGSAIVLVMANVLPVVLPFWNTHHVSGFSIVLPKQSLKISSSSSPFPVVLSLQARQQKQQIDDDDAMVFLTPIQIRTIRKDIIRKRANNKLPTIYYNGDENSDNVDLISVEQQIIDTLKSEQLVQVRGIALQDTDTRAVRNEAEQLAYRIQKQIQAPQTTSSPSALAHVFVVELKGHVATLFYYIPEHQLTTPFHQQHLKTTTALLSSNTTTSGSSRMSSKVQVRTTGKRNDWNKRPKALRDNAGQIIK